MLCYQDRHRRGKKSHRQYAKVIGPRSVAILKTGVVFRELHRNVGKPWMYPNALDTRNETFDKETIRFRAISYTKRFTAGPQSCGWTSDRGTRMMYAAELSAMAAHERVGSQVRHAQPHPSSMSSSGMLVRGDTARSMNLPENPTRHHECIDWHASKTPRRIVMLLIPDPPTRRFVGLKGRQLIRDNIRKGSTSTGLLYVETAFRGILSGDADDPPDAGGRGDWFRGSQPYRARHDCKRRIRSSAIGGTNDYDPHIHSSPSALCRRGV